MYSFERRLRAFSIDIAFSFLLFIIWIIIAYNINLNNETKMLVGLGIIILSTIIPQLISPGQSFGKRIQKMQIINVKTEDVPSLLILILREIFKWFFIIISFGFYSIIAGIISTNRRDGRTIHDFIFQTKTICLTRYLFDRYIDQTTENVKERLKGMKHND